MSVTLDDLQSASINEIAAALTRLQMQLNHARMDAKNPHYKSKYATLESVIDAAKKPLADNGLSVFQGAIRVNGKDLLVTQLMHISGQWLRSFTPILNEKNTCQSFGSGLSYARRYGLSACLNIGEEDDDGNEASAPRPAPQSPPEPQPKPEAKQPVKPGDRFGGSKKWDGMLRKFAKLGVAKEDILAKFKIPTLDSLTEKQVEELRWYSDQIASGQIPRAVAFPTATGPELPPDFNPGDFDKPSRPHGGAK